MPNPLPYQALIKVFIMGLQEIVFIPHPANHRQQHIGQNGQNQNGSDQMIGRIRRFSDEK